MTDIQFLVYNFGEEVEVIVRDETIWATQKSFQSYSMLEFQLLVNI